MQPHTESGAVVAATLAASMALFGVPATSVAPFTDDNRAQKEGAPLAKVIPLRPALS